MTELLIIALGVHAIAQTSRLAEARRSARARAHKYIRRTQ